MLNTKEIVKINADTCRIAELAVHELHLVLYLVRGI